MFKTGRKLTVMRSWTRVPPRVLISLQFWHLLVWGKCVSTSSRCGSTCVSVSVLFASVTREHTLRSDRADKQSNHWIMIWIIKYLLCFVHVCVCSLFCNLRMCHGGRFRGSLICCIKTQELQTSANLFISSLSALLRTTT